MKLLLFKKWLIECESLNEDGPHGKGWYSWKANHNHYRYKNGEWVWYNPSMPKGEKIRPMEPDEQAAAEAQDIFRRQQPVQPVQPVQPTRPVQPARQTPVRSTDAPWVLASASVNDEAHHLRVGQKVALKNNNDGTWTFAVYNKGKIQSYGKLPEDELKYKFKSDRSGQSLVTGEKASTLGKTTHEKPQQDYVLSAEQQKISDDFAEMKDNPNSQHMAIEALAGTGKTSTLLNLAKTYGGGNQQWLYLVFGSRNQQEAEEKFPKRWSDGGRGGVTVKTSHSFAGDVLKSNGFKPTDRIAEFTKNGTKLDAIIDGDAFKQELFALDILHFKDARIGGSLKWEFKSIWMEFTKGVKDIVSLAKAYALNPATSPDITSDITAVLKDYDINSDLERAKEAIEKDPNKVWINSQISHLMNVSDFLEENFMNKMVTAAIWVLQKAVPHGIDQKWDQKYEKTRGGQWSKLEQPIQRNLSEIRDFDDDLWYAATHADELDWTKPKRFDIVLVDEVQDFNQAQKKIIEKLIQTGAKIVAVGDRFQAMYKFRGATPAAFQDITNMLKSASANPEKTDQTLTKNWRSKPGIIDFSNQNTHVNNLVPGIENDPDDPAVITNMEHKQNAVMDILSHEMSHLGELKKQTAFLARTNEPLAKAAMELIKRKIPFLIYGKNLATDIVDVIDRVVEWIEPKAKGNNYHEIWESLPINEFATNLDEFVQSKKDKWSGVQSKQGELRDLMEAYEAIKSSLETVQSSQSSSSGSMSIKEFKDWLYKRLGAVPDYLKPAEKAALKKEIEETNPVVLTTAHRAKGLEFDRVFELTPSLYPHPKSKLDSDIAQEDNARYVSGTRARDEFHLVDDRKEG